MAEPVVVESQVLKVEPYFEEGRDGVPAWLDSWLVELGPVVVRTPELLAILKERPLRVRFQLVVES